MLRRRGIERVRPLAGGFDAWREHGLPVECEEGLPSGASAPAESSADTDDLGEGVVVDPSGEAVPLCRLWEERPVVVVFLRQFGCVLCRELVLALQARAPEIREAGAELIAVGNGQPEAAARFGELFALDFPVYVDPHRALYERLGFRRNLGGSANPAVLFAAVRAWLRGVRQGRTQGDPWQLGGLLIVRRGGEIVYRHESRFAGDHPDLGEVLERVRALA